MLSEKEIDEILKGIYEGRINLYQLPPAVYLQVGKRLESAVYQGYGGSLMEFKIGSPDFETLSKLRTNIYEFSAAKTFQETRDVQNFIFDDRGFKVGFSEFKKEADKVFEQYNVNWLETEYNTAISQAQSAANWQDIQDTKDVLPLLEFVTVGDDRVRPDHAELDGTVRPVDDPFWSYAKPPIDWNCRCLVIQHEQGAKPLTDISEKRKDIRDTIPPLFRNNPGKTKEIYDKEKHPYFEVPRGFEKQKDKNFGLPIPPPKLK